VCMQDSHTDDIDAVLMVEWSRTHCLQSCMFS